MTKFFVGKRKLLCLLPLLLKMMQLAKHGLSLAVLVGCAGSAVRIHCPLFDSHCLTQLN